MKHHYHLSLRKTGADGERLGEDIVFDFPSHDDIAGIIDKVRQKKLFGEDEIAAFCVGLKLFSGVMLNHRNEPLFAEFSQHFGEFMKTLKS